MATKFSGGALGAERGGRERVTIDQKREGRKGGDKKKWSLTCSQGGCGNSRSGHRDRTVEAGGCEDAGVAPILLQSREGVGGPRHCHHGAAPTRLCEHQGVGGDSVADGGQRCQPNDGDGGGADGGDTDRPGGVWSGWSYTIHGEEEGVLACSLLVQDSPVNLRAQEMPLEAIPNLQEHWKLPMVLVQSAVLASQLCVPQPAGIPWHSSHRSIYKTHSHSCIVTHHKVH